MAIKRRSGVKARHPKRSSIRKGKRTPSRKRGKKARRRFKGVSAKSKRDLKLQFGLRLLRTEKSIANAAQKSGLLPAKLRAYAIKKKLLIKRGKKWVVQKDFPRKLLVYSNGQEHIITVGKFKSASLVGEYMAGVRWFVQTNDLHHLEPFVGKSVKDKSGNRFPFETRPNVLHRLTNSGGSSFEDVYRLVV